MIGYDNYNYEYTNIDLEIGNYIGNKLKLKLIKQSDILFARENRTFDNGIPKKDLEKFAILKDYQDKDISYIITESIEIL